MHSESAVADTDAMFVRPILPVMPPVVTAEPIASKTTIASTSSQTHENSLAATGGITIGTPTNELGVKLAPEALLRRPGH